MVRTCPVSCKVCVSQCKDAHAECGRWVAAGECSTNPEFMLHACAESCGVCSTSHGDGCADENATACAAWERSGQCHHNTAYMLKHCASSCGLCRTLCKDHDESCAAWAQSGECDANRVVMIQKCPASCGLCSTLEQMSTYGASMSHDEL